MFAVRALCVFTLILALAACTTAGERTTTTTATLPVTATTTTSPATTPSTEPPPETCDPPGFLPTVLPERVIDDQPDVSAVPLDEFTLQPGTIVTGWTDESGSPALVMVRGGLPPTRWTQTPEEIEVRGVTGAVGPLNDGVWAVAWFEGPDRCDEYSLILYPPADAATAQMVAASLTG